MKTIVLRARSADEIAAAVSSAAELLRNGSPVALPTETVYGLAADALNENAALKIFAAKERPRFDPLIVHLPGREWVERVALLDAGVREMFEQLSRQFWPGPLTFVLPKTSIVPDVVTAGLETVAIRISSHPVFAAIIREFNGPLAAPSANRFGRISPTAASHVLDELDGKTPLIVDAGPTKHGLESTIVALRNNRIELLRRGPITEKQLSKFGEILRRRANSRVEAPGQLPSHYAPRTPLVLTDDASSFNPPAGTRCGLLAWKCANTARFAEVRRPSERTTLEEAGANLFRCLRELDSATLDLIVAEKFPEEGLGAAINERLRRAAK